MKKEDARIVKSKRKLYESLLKLMKDNIFEDITVCGICEKAGINRSTFYAHYDDKYTLLDGLIKDLQKRLQEELTKNSHYDSLRDYYMEMLKLLLRHFEKEKNIYVAIMVNNRNSVVMDMLYDAINDDIMRVIENVNIKDDRVPKEILVKFYMGAVFNVAREWIECNGKYSKEDIVNYLDELIPNYE